MLSVWVATVYLAPPIVQSEELSYNVSLSSAFSALHIHDRCKYLATMLVNCVYRGGFFDG